MTATIAASPSTRVPTVIGNDPVGVSSRVVSTTTPSLASHQIGKDSTSAAPVAYTASGATRRGNRGPRSKPTAAARNGMAGSRPAYALIARPPVLARPVLAPPVLAPPVLAPPVLAPPVLAPPAAEPPAPPPPLPRSIDRARARQAPGARRHPRSAGSGTPAG